MSNRTVRSDVHFDGLGFFPDFMRRFKRKATKNQALDNAEGVCERLAQTGIGKVASMTFVEEMNNENRYISFGPWKRNAVSFRPKRYNFNHYRRKFFGGYRAYCEILKRHRLKPIQALFLRHKYMSTLFGHNVQNIHNMADPRFKAYAADLANEMMLIEADVWGRRYKGSLKVGNEWSHFEREFGHTKDEAAHVIADLHRHIWEAVSWVVPPHKVVIDISHSEHAKAWFSQPSACPYCGREYDTTQLPGILRNGRPVMLPEVHGFSIEENLDERFTGFLATALNCCQKFSEDGGGGENALGYAVGRYRISNIEQTKAYHLKLWTGAKDAGKQCVSGIFPLETLIRRDDGKYRECYRVDVVNWDRIDAAVEQHVKVYGE